MNHLTPEVIHHEKVHRKHQGDAIDLLHFHRHSGYKGCEFHWHESLEFYYVYQGGISVISNGKSDWLYPGDIGFVNWCQPHRGCAFLNDTHYYVIKIHMSILDDCYSDAYQMPYEALLIHNAKALPAFIHQDHQLAQYFQRLVEELYDKNIGYELAAKSLVGLILSHILRSSQESVNIKVYQPRDNASSNLYPKNHDKNDIGQDPLHHIHHILQYISENYRSYITLDTLAIKLGLSKAYMCRIFKKHTGITILTYINELKCSHAASLILNGMPLQQTCEEVGFADYNYFSRLFKKIYNVSPRYYSKSNLTSRK